MPNPSSKLRFSIGALRRACAPVAMAMIEPLEDRVLLSVVRPDHIVVVIEEDRASDAIGDTAHMPYFNQLAASGLVYTNSHGVAHPSLPDYLALYSGSTQGINDNGNNHTFTGPNLAKSLNSTLLASGQYLSFGGFAESLPHDGDTTTRIAGDPNNPLAPPDLYMRNYNPMAQFTDVGAHGTTAITNAQVNKTFASFPTTAAGYASLPTVSFIIPNSLHNTHGSNEQAPYATDPSEYNFLRSSADTWLKNNLDGYLQWAKANNSLLIITTDEEETDSTPTESLTTIINGDPDLVVQGTNDVNVNHFNLLRTIEDMYGLTPLGNTATASDLTLNALGQLSFPGQVVAQNDSATSLSSSNDAPLYGQSVTFTATVTGAAGVPTGSVTFKDGATALGSANLNAAGQATFSTAALSVATHAITAVYSGDATYKISTSPVLNQVVNPAAPQQTTTTTLTSAPNPSVFGQAVTLVAGISSGASGTPSGTVTFLDGTTTIGTASVNASGQASLSISSLSVASHSITARYAGDPAFAASTSSALIHQVAQAATATALRSSANPAGLGKSVTFTATVTTIAPGSGIPTGKVQFVIDGVNFGTPVTLNNGSATSAATTALKSGSHSITAVYTGSANFAASTSPALTQSITASAPSAPTGVLASDGTYTDRVRITWNASANATAYEIWRGTSSSSSAAKKISATDVTTTTYDDTSALGGTTYYYWVKAKNAAGTSGFSSSNTGFRAIGALVNDSFANRIAITGPSVTLTASNKGASKEVGEPNHGGNVGGKSIWYTWTAPASGKLTIDTTGSNFDTLLGVYTGTSVSALTLVPGGSNDDNPAGGTTTSKVVINVTAGVTYQIAIDGYNGVYGNITLHLNLV
jgi:hypothetical protein